MADTLDIAQNSRALALKRLMADPDFQTLDRGRQSQVINAVISGATAPSKGGGAVKMPTAPFRSPPPAAERSREIKLSDQAQQIINLTTEMENLWNQKLKKRFDPQTGDLSSFHEGARYVYPGYFEKPVDPDVDAWIVSAGEKISQ